MASLGDLFVTVGAKIDGFESAFSTVDQKLKAVDAQANKVGAGFTAMGERMSSFGTTLTASVTAPITGLGLAVAVIAGKFEQTETAFKNFLGSAEAATEFLNELKQFAASTPFELPGLLESAKKMLAFGFAASEVLPMLRTIGDAVAGIGGGAAEIDRVTLALGQMQAKGKVSAQEMNQLAELGIPAWKMLAEQIGVSIPQAMKMAEQGAISASVAIPAILAGMNAKFEGLMEEQSQTLLGMWSNLKDQINLTLMDIGKVLVPEFKEILQSTLPLLESVKNLATAFAAMDTETQKTILGMVAVLAAIGPVLIVVGQMAIAIGGLMSAKVALGGAMTALATKVAPAAAGLGGMATAVIAVATAINAFLAAAAHDLGEFLGGRLTAALGLTRDMMEDVEAKAKTTGAAAQKAMGDMAWETIKAEEAAKKLSSEQSKLTEEQKKLEAELKKEKDALKAAEEAKKAAKEEAEKLKKEQERLKEETARVAQATRDASVEWRIITADAIAAGKRQDELKDSIVRLTTEIRNGQPPMDQMLADLGTLKLNSVSAEQAIEDLKNAAVPGFSDMATGMVAVKDRSGDLNTALGALGIKSETEFRKVAAEAAAARDAVLGSGIATDFEKQTAIYKALEAQVAAARVAGETIPAEQTKLLAKMKAELDTTLNGEDGSVSSKWGDMTKNVSTVITNFAQDIGKALFDGDMSWGEKVKGMLKSLGAAVASSFIEPAATAIAGFITNTIMGALKGAFDNVGEWLGSLGSSMAGIFGGGASGAAGAVGGAAGGIGGAVGGVGGAAGGAAAGGLVGWLGAIGSIGSMVSGIFGNFQTATTNSILKMIEENTRFGYLHTSNLLQPIYDLTDDFRLRWAGGLGIFNQEGDSGVRLAPYEFNGGYFPVDVKGGGATSITVQGNVIGNEQFIRDLATAVAAELRLQGSPG